MAMNFNALFEDPTFMMGASLLGNNSPDAMTQAIAASQAMTRTKLAKQNAEQEREMEKARTELYRRQTLTAEQNAARKLKLQEQMEPLFGQVKGLIGGLQPQPGIQNAHQQPQPAQGDSRLVPGSLAPGEVEPTAAQGAALELQRDVESLKRELARAPNADARMILTQELDKKQKSLQVAGGIAQQQQVAQAQAVQQGMAPHRALQAMGGLAKLAADDYSGIGDIGTALKPETHRPGDVIRGPLGQQEIIDDPGQRLREQEAERNAREFQQKEGRLAREHKEVLDQRKREYGDAPTQAQRTEMSKGLAKNFLDAQAEEKLAASKQARMQMLGGYLEHINTGKFTPAITQARLWLKDAGIAVDPKASDAQIADMVSKQLAMEWKELSPGSITVWEQEQFQSITPGIGKDPAANKALVEAYAKLQQRKIETARIYREHKKANKGEINDSVHDEIAKYAQANPLFDPKEMERLKAGTPAGAPASDDRYEQWKKSKGLK